MRLRLHIASRWLIGISLFFASIFGYVGTTLFDEDGFATRLGVALDDPGVRRGLSGRAVDVAFDSLNPDSLLADSLPEEIRAGATPALELTKPAVAAAGAELLGVPAVKDGIETAARSIHRQTVSAVLAAEETDVVVNTRPVLVVTADAIVGPAGARAAVGVDLPDSATSVNLGSNRSAVWATVRALDGFALISILVGVLATVAYFATATSGTRLLATRRLGKTLLRCGVAVLVFGSLVGFIAGVALEAALSTGSGVSLANLNIGGSSDQFAGLTLGQILFQPMVAGGRRIVLNGLLVIAAAYLFGSGVVAQGFRAAVTSRDLRPLVDSMRVELPQMATSVRLWINAGLVVVLIGWTTPTLRIVLTLSGIALALHLALSMSLADRRPWTTLRQSVGWPAMTVGDHTDRTPNAQSIRHVGLAVALVAVVVWPTYNRVTTGVLVGLVAAAFAASYWWELAPSRAEKRVPAVAERPEPVSWSTGRKIALGSVGALLLLVLAAPGNGAQNPAQATSLTGSAPERCNGHRELCDRPLDEVVFAGTHNSMSASALGWELANHEGAIPAQLAGGIRALLIDVQRWEVDVNLSELEFDPQAAALAAEALAGAEPPEDGLWMCHKLCQLGGTPFRDFLADIRAFVEANPDEVVIIVIQDDAPKAAIKSAIEEADLVRFALVHEPGTPWPTLGEMIAADTRLVFMAEADADPDGWYQAVYDGNVEETGFRYDVAEDFDCAPNRGLAASSMLLVNHWVETGIPVPDEADRVNSELVLRERVAECERVRGRLPSVIAVNFWERGDLLSVVDELNDVS